MASRTGNVSAYAAIVSHIFSAGYKPGIKKIPFHRDEIVAVARKLKVSFANRKVTTVLRGMIENMPSSTRKPECLLRVSRISYHC